MKKLFAISLIVAGTFASATIASADTLYANDYASWAAQALTTTD